MVTQFGMSEILGAINYGSERPNPFGVGGASRDVAISEDTSRAIDAEVRRFLDDAHDRARALVSANRGLLDDMVRELLEHEVLDHDALKSFLDRVNVAPVIQAGAATA